MLNISHCFSLLYERPLNGLHSVPYRVLAIRATIRA